LHAPCILCRSLVTQPTWIPLGWLGWLVTPGWLSWVAGDWKGNSKTQEIQGNSRKFKEIHRKFKEIHLKLANALTFCNVFGEFPGISCEFPAISLNFLEFPAFWKNLRIWRASWLAGSSQPDPMIFPKCRKFNEIQRNS